jgi:hypothetical protein
MHEHNQVAHRGASRPKTHNKPDELKAIKSNQLVLGYHVSA